MSTGAAKADRKGGDFYSDVPVLTRTGTRRRTGFGYRDEYTVDEPIVFEAGARGSGLIVYVLDGYVTDGFSLPGMLLQVFQPKDPLYLQAAILHDWLYDMGLVSRDICDRILLNAMRAVSVPRWQRLTVFWAVRAFGWGGFNKRHSRNLKVLSRARQLDVREAALIYLKQKRGEQNV